MKIRNGFVSNSSSSSFCIYGIYIKEKDILTCEELHKKGLIDTVNENDEDFDAIDSALTKIGLSTHLTPWSCDEESVYIGVSWQTVKDDETGAQFKERVEHLVKQVVKKPQKIKCESFEEAYNDNF